MTGRALVLGGGGFLGSHLARGLLSAGWEVSCVVRDPRSEQLARRLGDAASQVHLIAGDAGDPGLLDRVVPGIDAVFPCTGRSGAALSVAQPLLDLEAGPVVVLSLLEALRRGNQSARMVLPGSRLQYGQPHRLPVAEDDPQLPTSPYGAHRLLSEHYANIYHRVHGLPVACLRISNPYGPHQGRPDQTFGLVGNFLATAEQGGTISLFGGGSQLRDYLFVGDLVELFLRAATVPAAIGRAYNAGGPRPVSIADMARAVVATVGRGSVALEPWPARESAIETGDYHANLTRAREELGWVPRVALGDGLAATWASMREG